MADRCARCAGTVVDVVVADTATSGKELLQAADVLVCVVRSPALAGQAAARLLAEYPGCAAVAVLVQRDGDLPCRCVVGTITGRAPWWSR